MGAQQNIGSGIRKPGTAVTIDDSRGGGSPLPGTKRIALVGTIATGGSMAAATPTQVFSTLESDAAAGQGGILALMARRVFDVLKTAQDAIEVWLCGAADPAGTKATYTLTAAGTATGAGDVIFKVSGRTMRASVAVGDDANTVAATIKAKVDEFAKNLPVTAGVVAAVVTLTAVVSGVNGNDILVEVLESPAGITVTPASGVAGAGAIDITAALDALGASPRNYYHVAVENHTATDITDADSHLDEMWASMRKSFRWVWFGENGTLGTATTLAAGANDKRQLIMSCENCPNLPGEMAAAAGAKALTHPRPSYNWDFTELPLYPPTADPDAYTDGEIETALAAGVTPLIPTSNGKLQIVRLVTTKTTEAGAPFEGLLDYSNSRTTAHYAELWDTKASQMLKGQNVTTELLTSLRDAAYILLKEGEEAKDLHNVDAHKDEIIVESHPDIPTRILSEIPSLPTPNAHQLDATVIMIVEAAEAA